MHSYLAPIIFFIALSTFSLSKTEAREFLLEGKAGYFYPTNDLFRELYGDGKGIYGAELTGEICNSFYGWASVNYFSDSGHSIGLSDPTKIRIIPVGLGVKYMCPLNCFTRFYFGGGFLATHLHTHDFESPIVIPRVDKWGFGGIVKTGFLVFLSKCWFIDVFADWSYMHIDFHNTEGYDVIRLDADLSGFSGGAGIGYRF